MLRAWTRGRKVAAVVAAGSVAALALGGPLAGASQATTSRSLGLYYSCAFSWWSGPHLGVELTGDVPSSLAPGESFSIGNLRGTVTIPEGVATVLHKSAKTLTGTISTFDFAVLNGSPSWFNVAPITFGPVTLVAGRAARFGAPEVPQSLGPFTAGSRGNVTIAPGELGIVLPVGALECGTPLPRPGGSATWTIPVLHRVAPALTAALPVSTFGGLGAAALAGSLLVVRQRRKSQSSHLSRNGR